MGFCASRDVTNEAHDDDDDDEVDPSSIQTSKSPSEAGALGVDEGPVGHLAVFSRRRDDDDELEAIVPSSNTNNGDFADVGVQEHSSTQDCSMLVLSSRMGSSQRAPNPLHVRAKSSHSGPHRNDDEMSSISSGDEEVEEPAEIHSDQAHEEVVLPGDTEDHAFPICDAVPTMTRKAAVASRESPSWEVHNTSSHLSLTPEYVSAIGASSITIADWLRRCATPVEDPLICEPLSMQPQPQMVTTMTTASHLQAEYIPKDIGGTVHSAGLSSPKGKSERSSTSYSRSPGKSAGKLDDVPPELSAFDVGDLNAEVGEGNATKEEGHEWMYKLDELHQEYKIRNAR